LSKGGRLATIGGSPPDLANLPAGCAFAERCTMAQDACRAAVPPVVVLAPGHQARCWRTDVTAKAPATA
jgi:peptide/nickel transport system ATP-binding protein